MLESPPLLHSNRLIITILFLTASVTASDTVTEATAHCADNEYKDKAGHRQAGHKKKDVQPRATFSIAKEPPPRPPFASAMEVRQRRSNRKRIFSCFMVSLDSNRLTDSV